ncbi:sialate O-acetylesterase [soil metagenome]
MPTSSKISLLILIFFFSFFQVKAEVSLPKLVGDYMVLQRDQPINIWGWADPGEDIQVIFRNQRISTQADPSGEWKITLASEKAGGPFDLVISGTNTIRIKDVLLGDVWVCSGQSNMEWPLGRLEEKYSDEIANAQNNEIRFLTVENNTASTPQKDIKSSGWQIASPETVKDFSAVGYFFGRDLYQTYKIPVGLISSDWGGTVAEAWTSPEALKKFPEFRAEVEKMTGESAEEPEKEFQQKLTEWNKAYRKADQSAGLNVKSWAGSKIDDKSWNSMTLPTLWESAGLPDFDGIVWFRKEVNIPKSLAGKDLTLSLGAIDDNDSSWFNGQFIGSTNQYNMNRKYKVPGKIVKAGKNIIAVKVVDSGGGGGIWGEPDAMRVVAGNETIPLQGSWKYKVALDHKDLPPKPQDINNPNKPAVLFNGMIAPLLPYAIKGVIWYQGESNASRAKQYQKLFPALIRDWRTQWGQKDLPFLFVQLANFMEPKEEPGESAWAELREAQFQTLALPNTGMAVIIDIGEANDIHPKNKLDVGKRLALAARKIAYQEELVYSGPVFESFGIKGDKAILQFKETGSGLETKGGSELKEFYVAGSDKKFYRAKAVIENNQVIVSHEQVPEPVAVRYAWADNPEEANLYNQEGLPASPFRTDSWEGITE